MFSRLVWTCLDPSSPQNIVFLFYFGWLTTLSSFPLEEVCAWTAKGQYCFRQCNVFGGKIAFCDFCAPKTSLSVFQVEKVCVWTTKNQCYFRSCNRLTKNNEYIQTINDFSAGNKPFSFHKGNHSFWDTPTLRNTMILHAWSFRL